MKKACIKRQCIVLSQLGGTEDKGRVAKCSVRIQTILHRIRILLESDLMSIFLIFVVIFIPFKLIVIQDFYSKIILYV